jgi:hypothetical protein
VNADRRAAEPGEFHECLRSLRRQLSNLIRVRQPLCR